MAGTEFRLTNKWGRAALCPGGHCSEKVLSRLERLYSDGRGDEETLNELAHELAHRKTQRAQALAGRVRTTLEELEQGPAEAPAPTDDRSFAAQPEDQAGEPPELDVGIETADPEAPPAINGANGPPSGDEPSEDGALNDRPVAGALPPDPSDAPGELGNSPNAILELWTALEVLSPQTYLRPEDLADGERQRIARFGEGKRLPWIGQTETARPGTKLYYQVILGAVSMDVAGTTLLKAFGDQRPERPSARGYAALAAVTVDRHGRPVAENPIAVSSFGWGYGLARTGRLAELKAWPQVERDLVEGLEHLLKRENDDEVLPRRGGSSPACSATPLTGSPSAEISGSTPTRACAHTCGQRPATRPRLNARTPPPAPSRLWSLASLRASGPRKTNKTP